MIWHNELTETKHQPDKMANQIKIEMPVRADITIRRPNGNIEVVAAPGTKELNDKLFSRINAATKEAGRGECLSYENITEEKLVDGPSDAELEADEYHRQTKAACRDDAYGEDHDDLSQDDRTPSHKPDY